MTSKTNAKTPANPSAHSIDSKNLKAEQNYGSAVKPTTSNLKKYVNAEVPKEGRASVLRHSTVQTISYVSGPVGAGKSIKGVYDESLLRKSNVDSIIKLYDEEIEQSGSKDNRREEQEWLKIQVEDDPDD